MFKVLSGVVLLFSYVYTRVWKSRPKKVRTILDIKTSDDVIALLRHVGHDTISGDELVNKLYRIYRYFPPKEEDMRVLFILHEENQNKGTLHEYACTTLYAVATDVLLS